MPKVERQDTAPVGRFALIVSIAYGIVALLWIYASDGVLEYLAIDAKSLSLMQTWKGAGFVALTSLMLYAILLYRPLDAMSNVASIDRHDRRNRLIVLAVSALLVVAVLVAVSLVLLNERGNILAQTQRTTTNLVQVIEEQTARSIDAVDAALRVTFRLAEGPSGHGGAAHDADVRKVLQQQIENLPFVRAIWILDTDGNVTHDSENLPGADNFAHRDYFRVHRDDAKTRPVRGQAGDQPAGRDVHSTQPPHRQRGRQFRRGDRGSTGAALSAALLSIH